MAAPTQTETRGDLIRRSRLRAGLTQEGLAERAGISPRSVSDLERDVERAHYAHTLRRLADALSLNEDERAALLAAGSTETSHGPADTTGPVLLPTAPT